MKKLKRITCIVYFFIVTIPDRLYPFSEEIEGKKVRGKHAYDFALARIQDQFGYGSYSPELIMYRGVFHVIGASLFILFSTLITKELFDTDRALYVMFFFAVFALLYQELYIQKRTHGQRMAHSFIDWFSWVIPMSLYVFVHYLHIHGETLVHFFMS